MRGRSRLAVAAVLGAGLMAAAPSALAAACTRTWDGGAGTTDWATAANWDGDVLPVAADVVCIAGAVVVQHASGATSVAELHLSTPATLDVAGGALSVLRVELDGGTISGAGALTVGGGILQGILKIPGPSTSTITVATLDAPLVDVRGGTLELVSAGWTQLASGALSGKLSLFGSSTVRTPAAIEAVATGGSLTKQVGSTLTAVAGPSLALPTRIAGTLNVNGGFSTLPSLEVLAGGTVTLNGSGVAVTTAAVRNGGVLAGDVVGNGILAVANGLTVESGAVVRGSLTLNADVDLAGKLEPGFSSTHAPAVEVTGALREASTASHTVTIPGPGPDGVARLGVGGAAVLGGTLTVDLAFGFVPAMGSEWVIATFASSSGDFGRLDLDRLSAGIGAAPIPAALALRRTATDLRVVVVPAGPPVVGVPSVGLGTTPLGAPELLVTVGIDDNHGGGYDASLDVGPTTAYGTRVRMIRMRRQPGDEVWHAQLMAPLPPGTYHVRVIARNPLGETVGPDGTFVVADPSPPAPPAPPALAPVRDAGSRTFAATRLRTGALRVPFAYRLVQTCASPCAARVELRLRSGKQLYAAGLAGDGKVLATRRGVRLTAGANGLRLDVPKAALRGVRWTPAGRRFQTVKVRLRVVLPQADGRALVTVRDGLLRVLRPRPEPR